MAIVVEGLKLPWACIACPFRVYRASDEVSLCVATNQNGVDCATPVELPSYDGRSSFCPLKEQPEIIRCKDCKHQNWVNAETGNIVCKIAGRGANPPDWFCADGERRADG